MVELDLYLLATQGQFSEKGFITVGNGFFIYIEEEIIDVPKVTTRNRGNVEYKPLTKKKRIYVKVDCFDGNIFEKSIILDDISLTVIDVQYLNKEVILSVETPVLENSRKNITISF